jgi:hypothetical protein
LAAAMRKVEWQYRRGHVTNLVESLIEPIRERYELVGVGLPAGATMSPLTPLPK